MRPWQGGEPCPIKDNCGHAQFSFPFQAPVLSFLTKSGASGIPGSFSAQSPRFSGFCPGTPLQVPPSPLLPGDLLSRDLLPRSSFQVLCGPQRIPSPLSYPSEPGLMQLPATSRLTPQHKPLRTRKKFQAAPPLLLAWLPTGLLGFFCLFVLLFFF